MKHCGCVLRLLVAKHDVLPFSYQGHENTQFHIKIRHTSKNRGTPGAGQRSRVTRD